MSTPVASEEFRRRLVEGQVLGGLYRIVRTLHEGRQGVVLEAEHLASGGRVAVKMLAGHSVKDLAAQTRLNKEVELLKKLDHPHVVQVIDFNRTSEGVPYLVMDLLEGEPLSARLAPGQVLEIPQALTIGSHVASALTAAHAKGISHRALTPRHVNLAETDNGTFARVLGFGIAARSVGSESGEHALVPSTRYLAYIAPEQKKPGGEVADELSDQYALSVLLYQMLTGFVPEVRGGVMSLFRRAQSPITPPSAYRSGIPPALDRVLLRGLSQDPSGRYPRTSDFAAALLEAGRNYVRRSLHPTERPSVPSGAPNSAFRTSKPSSVPPRTSPPTSSTIVPPAVSRKSSAGPSSLTGELAELETLIRAARSAVHQQDAVDAVLRALATAESTNSTQVERRVSDNHRFFEEILQRSLGGPSSNLELGSTRGDASVLTPKRAFLLSRIDGETSLGEIVQLSPLPRLETLAHLGTLLHAGLIRVKN